MVFSINLLRSSTISSWITLVRAAVGAILFAQLTEANEHFKRGWKLPEINTNVSLDPVSLITLFFDDAEKDLVRRSGDLTLLSCFGLFVNPSTAWIEYGSLYPGQGVRYYNPGRLLTSTVEVEQVHNYITKLADDRENTGIIIRLYPRRNWMTPSAEWLLIRPLILCSIVIVAALSLDFMALGAIGALLLGQAIVVIRTVSDGTDKVVDDDDSTLEKNVFFLANNVTVIVESYGNLFVDACASSGYKKIEKPVRIQVFSTLIFMTGILLIGLGNVNSKIAYLVGHALQAAILAMYSKEGLSTRTLNRVTWEVGKPVDRVLKRRRDAYLWVTEETTGNTEWLTLWQLAAPETLAFVQESLSCVSANSESANSERRPGSDVVEGTETAKTT